MNGGEGRDGGNGGGGGNGARDRTAAARDTRARLIDVAERLFAEYGVESVSLRTVGIEAGQRNNSAAQYHFGSKDGLIAAIIAARSATVDARRTELADALRASAEPPGTGALIDLLVLPLVEAITGSEERTWYLRFLANVMDHPMFDAPWRPAPAGRPAPDGASGGPSTGTSAPSPAQGSGAPEPPNPPALRYMRRELRRLLPDLPDGEFERRLRWTMMTAFRVLADYERQRATTGSAPPARQAVADLNAMLVALLQAPYPVA